MMRKITEFIGSTVEAAEEYIDSIDMNHGNAMAGVLVIGGAFLFFAPLLLTQVLEFIGVLAAMTGILMFLALNDREKKEKKKNAGE